MNWLWSLFPLVKQVQNTKTTFDIDYYTKLLEKQKIIREKYNEEKKNYALYQKEFTERLLKTDPHCAFPVIRNIYCMGYNPIYCEKIIIIQNIIKQNTRYEKSASYDYLKYDKCNMDDIYNAVIHIIKNPQRIDIIKQDKYIDEYQERYSQYRKIYEEYITINDEVLNARNNLVNILNNNSYK